MIYSSLAVLAMAASAAVPPLGNLIHMHPRAKQHDDRVTVLLVNNEQMFRDVKVGGHTYTVNAHSNMRVKGPAGTLIYRASPSPFHARGEVLVALTPTVNDQQIDVK